MSTPSLTIWLTRLLFQVHMYSMSTHDSEVGQNVDEGVVIAYTALYSKIHLKILMLKSILQVPKCFGLSQGVK